MRRSTAALLAMGAVAPLAAGLGWWSLRADELAAPAAAARPAPAPAAGATLDHWEPGSRRTYRFDYDASGDFAMGEDGAGKRAAFSMSIGGTLTATVVDESDGRRDVEIAIVPEALTSSGVQLSVPPAQLREAMARPFVVSYSARGTIEAVAFTGITEAQVSLLLRELVSYLQITFEPAESWTSVELEPAGEVLVLNRRLGDGGILKEKQRFVRVARSAELVEPARTDGVPRFVRSSATYHVDTAASPRYRRASIPRSPARARSPRCTRGRSRPGRTTARRQRRGRSSRRRATCGWPCGRPPRRRTGPRCTRRSSSSAARSDRIHPPCPA